MPCSCLFLHCYKGWLHPSQFRANLRRHPEESLEGSGRLRTCFKFNKVEKYEWKTWENNGKHILCPKEIHSKEAITSSLDHRLRFGQCCCVSQHGINSLADVVQHFLWERASRSIKRTKTFFSSVMSIAKWCYRISPET